VRIWDPKTGKCTFAIEDGSQPFAPAAPVCCIAAHSGRQLVIAGCVDGNAMVININTGKVSSYAYVYECAYMCAALFYACCVNFHLTPTQHLVHR
jgi:WD40 repeat protein